jgi:hypothetical protein
VLNSGSPDDFPEASLRAQSVSADPPPMPVESNDLLADRARAAGPPLAPRSSPGRAEREEIVRDRLCRLLAVLGDVPFQRPISAPNWGNALRHLLDDICPAGTVVIHARRVPDTGLRLEHLAVAPRGLVVIGPYLSQTPPGSLSRHNATIRSRSASGGGSAALPRAQPGARRPGPVRETLCRSRAMRSWLAGTRWAEVPVLAAVCSAAVLGPTANPARALGGLWLGPANELPGWLASGESLAGTTCGALAYFLASELPPG